MDPYKVLGVSETASDEEVRSAYLKLVKQYHPDKYVNNPLADLATEKLKEINEAYDTITAQRAGRKSGSGSGGSYGNSSGRNSGYGSSSYSGYGSSSYSGGGQSGYGNSTYSGQYASEFSKVRSYLNANDLKSASRLLDSIPAHNAEWNYLYGLVYFRSNNFSYARTCFEAAVSMDPNNAEYRQAYETLVNRSNRSYRSEQSTRSSSDGCDTACNICSTLWCMNACCNCFGGGC
ncbi:MAG: DnaJ domain-containing protein [Eubacteriales bacterium]|nr:DnaJ domain-containing protein [Clostridium sp.]MDY5798790.1 DnaJ domain-containing protein [Eubacteriales bacterium]